jgi:two-component system nitrogen regulation response regulator NtrX
MVARVESNGLNILVVDDQAPVTDAIKIAFNKSGHSLDIVGDGSEAWARLKEKPDHYQVLIIDHFMSNMTGLDLVERLKPTQFKGKIVVVSGYLTVELEMAFKKLGISTILRKPFRLDELRAAVEGGTEVKTEG